MFLVVLYFIIPSSIDKQISALQLCSIECTEEISNNMGTNIFIVNNLFIVEIYFVNYNDFEFQYFKTKT